MLLQSGHTRSKVIYLVEPTHFDVQYIINPWMTGNIGAVNKRLALQQWNNLVATLNVVGVHTTVLPPAPNNCPDAVFVANAGLIIGNTFIRSTFKHAVRTPEEPYFTDYFADAKYDVHYLTAPITFEGAGDALFSNDNKILFLGHGLRSDKGVEERMIKLGGNFEIIQLDMINPYFYHLDTCFCPLDTGGLLWYPPAFSKESISKIQAIYPQDQRIVVSLEDANSFGCNTISLGKTMILPQISYKLQQTLYAKGYDILSVDMSEFLKAGGGPKCCILKIN